MSWITSSGFASLATSVGATPWARPERYGIRRYDGVVFGPRPEHRMDVYLPPGDGPHPVAIYFHGGGFRALSRRTHWLFGLAFARAGYATFLPDYRLAPTHPFPAAAEDACLATRWVWDNASRFGGDRTNLVLTGESAGGNLSVVSTLASVTDRPEPWAQPLREVVPTALIPFCGLHQTSAPERYEGTCPALVQDIIDHTCLQYAQGVAAELADPVNTLEALGAVDAWPRTFVPWGGGDPIAHDSVRLLAALERLGAPVTGREYGRAGHAFHAYVWQPDARACWEDVYQFLGVD
ncbi:MAG: alpha/beta hydrolase [Proteobacteria bacterium]|nr:alpha/beta hydrolase [Pseudomonadota bacterium]MCP4917846.1 alpha/beta hydrolase [Pseudomonadota bacterium]